ncbi:WD40 repeat domain-containing protein [Microcoleus anatoxicus]|uniref:WD40 repeat domain-containing protein n=1 Tax=Microcoleus anatoxicus PTRS2 TaxID=2705321 RepID=A0ABU8YRG8_9CYAN
MSNLKERLANMPSAERRDTLEMPIYLANAREAKRLQSLLTNFDFIDAKISHKEFGVQPLITDYDLALQPDIEISEEIKDNLKLIQSAIRMSANVLTDDPSQLPSQLLGRLISYRSVDESEIETKSLPQILLKKVIVFCKEPPEFVETLMLLAREVTFNILVKPLQFIDDKLPSRFSLYPFLGWWYKFVKAATNWIVKLIFIYPCVSYQVSDLMKKRYWKPKPPYFFTIDVFLEQVEKSKDRPWLRPLTPSLTPSGESLIRTLSLQTDNSFVRAIAITPDGTKMVSGLGDKSLIVWDMKTGTPLKTLTGHNGSVDAVAVTKDGKQIVSASTDSTIKIWNIETGENIDTFIGHQSSIRAIAITPDGKNIVSASHDTTLKIWDLQTGECLCTCIGHQKSVSVLAIHPDGDKVISGSDDKRLILWDLKTGQLLREIKTFEGYFYAISITNYGISLTKNEKKLLVATRVGKRDNPFEVCDISTGEVLKNFTTDETWLGTCITRIAITPDETKVVAASEDRYGIKILSLKTGIPLGSFEAHTGQYVTALAITPDGKQVVTGAWKTIKIWDLTKIQTKSKIKSLIKHGSSVQALAITPDGKQAISGDGNGTIIIWDIDSQKPIETLPRGYNGIKSIAVTPDGQKFVSTFVSGEGSYKGVEIWNLHNTKKLFGNCRAEREVETVAITPDSKYIVSALNNSIIIWELESQNIFRELYDTDLRPITSVVITPDGKYIIAGTVRNLLVIWDFKSGNKIKVIELLNKWNGHDSRESITSIAVTPNSQQLISASTDKSIRIWDIAQGTELKNFSIHNNSANAVVVNPSGDFAISGDYSIKVWHIQTGKIVASFSVESSVLSCAITSDGLTIVAGELSGRVHFLRLEGIDLS